MMLCLCIMLAGSGCRTGRRVAVDRTFGEKDSLVAERYDRLRAEHLWKSDMQTTLRWEEVSLSAPDSNGRRYVGQRQACCSGLPAGICQSGYPALIFAAGKPPAAGNSGYGAERK